MDKPNNRKFVLDLEISDKCAKKIQKLVREAVANSKPCRCQLENMIDRGILSNTLVYDNESANGSFSLRLVHLMQAHTRRIGVYVPDEYKDYGKSEKLVKIYVPYHSIIRDSLDLPLPNDIMKETRIYGVEIINSPDMTKYYLMDRQNKTWSTSLPSNKSTVVVGVTNNNNVVLGAF